jgi:hypothetical protein
MQSADATTAITTKPKQQHPADQMQFGQKQVTWQ